MPSSPMRPRRRSRCRRDTRTTSPSVLHERDDRPPQGRDAQPSQPRRQLVAQDDRLRPAARRRVPRRWPVLPRRRHRSRALDDLAGRLARRAPRLRRRRRASTPSSGTASPSYMPVPTMLAALVDEQRVRPRDVSSLRLIGHAGSPITTSLIRYAHETFPAAELAQYYGATETAAIVTCLAHEERLLDGGPLGRCGQPVVGVAVDVRRRRRSVVRARRRRRGRRSRAERHGRVLGGRRGDGGRVRRRVVPHGRRRLPRRRAQPLAARPGQGHDRHGRRERLLDRGRGGPQPAIPPSSSARCSACPTSNGSRPSTPSSSSTPSGRSATPRRRAARALPRLDRRLQGAQAHRAAHRAAAQVGARQGARSANSARRTGTSDPLTG